MSELFDGGEVDKVLVADFAQKQASRSRHEQKTEAIRGELTLEIAKLKEQRMKLRLEAARHAGNLGLIYDSKTNQFYRVIVSEVMPLDPQAFYDNTLRSLNTLASDIGKFDEVGRNASSESQSTESPEGSNITNADSVNEVMEVKSDSSDQSVRELLSSSSDVPRAQALANTSVVERPRSPELLSPIPRVIQSELPKHSFVQILGATVPWIIAGFVGCFVGYGLMMISGLLGKKSPPIITGAGMVLGVAVIFGLKLLLDKVWYECSRNKELGVKNTPIAIVWGCISILLIVAESFLGGKAIVKYSEAVSFSQGEKISILNAMLIACTISAASLIYSAVHGSAKGKRSIDHRDAEAINYSEQVKHQDKVHQRLCKEYEEELQNWKSHADKDAELRSLQHLANVNEHNRSEELQSAIHKQKMVVIEKQGEMLSTQQQRWLDASGQAGDLTSSAIENRERRQKEFEHFRSEPDFQALCQYIAAIDICSAEIADQKEMMTNETIRRGYLRSNAELL